MSLRNCGHSFLLTISFDTGTEWGIFDTSISWFDNHLLPTQPLFQ
jgi:hypothetical protein